MDDAKKTVVDALELARKRVEECPTFGIYISCVSQLEYLLDVLDGRQPIDRPKLRTIMIGHYGMREFEETDPQFSRALIESQFVASKMGNGLKI